MARRLFLDASVAAAAAAVLVTAGIVLTVSAAPAAAEPPAPPYTAWTLNGDRHIAAWLGRSEWLDDLTVTAPSPERLQFDGESTDTTWRLYLGPPTGSTWAVGSYATADTSSPVAADVDLSRYGSVCQDPEGTLTVHEVERANGLVSAFAASFEVHCHGYPGVVRSELRFNSTMDWKAATSDTSWINLNSPSGFPSPPTTVTLTGRGSLPATVSQVSLDVNEDNVGKFEVVADNCSGAQLAFGETCTFGVRATALGPSGGGHVVVVDDTPSGPKYIYLNSLKQNVEPPPIPAPTYTPPPGWDNTGTFYALPPQRILDTREGNGAPQAKLGSGGEIDLAVAGRGGVPAEGVSAAVLNVTVTNATAPSFLTVYPQGGTRPLASSLNFVGGWTGANMVTVGLGESGGVSIFNNNGTVDVIADVIGYYAADGSMIPSVGTGTHYNPIVPWRLLDSRERWGYPLRAQHQVSLPFTFGDELDPHIRAVAVNVTAVGAAAPGFLTTWDGHTQRPLASTLNYTTGAVVPNMAVVPISRCSMCPGLPGRYYPTISVYTNATTHVLIDVVGVYDNAVLGEGLRFTPLTPTRIADSRVPVGLPGVLGPATTRTVATPSEIVTAGTYGLALNVTAVSPTAHGFVSVWPAGVSRPLVSNLNTAPGQTLPNSVYTLLGAGDAFQVYNHAGNTHVIADVVGTFYYLPEVGGNGLSSAEPRLLREKLTPHAVTAIDQVPSPAL